MVCLFEAGNFELPPKINVETSMPYSPRDTSHVYVPPPSANFEGAQMVVIVKHANLGRENVPEMRLWDLRKKFEGIDFLT